MHGGRSGRISGVSLPRLDLRSRRCRDQGSRRATAAALYLARVRTVHRIFHERTSMSVSVARSISLVLFCAIAAGAQVDTVRRDSTERPFVRGGVYDKPYLTSLMGRTAIGG